MALVAASSGPVLGTPSGMVAAEINLAAIEADFIKAEAEVNATRHALTRLVAHPPGTAATARERAEWFSAIEARRGELAARLLEIRDVVVAEVGEGTTLRAPWLREVHAASAGEGGRRNPPGSREPQSAGDLSPPTAERRAEVDRAIAAHRAATDHLREAAAQESRLRPIPRAVPAMPSTPLDRFVPAELRTWAAANRRHFQEELSRWRQDLREPRASSVPALDVSSPSARHFRASDKSLLDLNSQLQSPSPAQPQSVPMSQP